MGLTERHWFENEDVPENYEWDLEDAVYNSCTNKKADTVESDREKVIKGLETIKQFFGYGLPSTAEMFDSYYGTLNDAIALLKEQEETELCDRCGRRRMKSEWEARRKES